MGWAAEAAFVLRLLELGYSRIFRPVVDYGVDVLVETERGRIAVQVKTAKTNKHRSKKPRTYLDLSSSAKHQLFHYRRLGVDVFAVRAVTGFYLVRAEDVTAQIFDVTRGPFFEAWERAFGLPARLDSEREEVTQLEAQYALDLPSPPRSASPPGRAKGGA